MATFVIVPGGGTADGPGSRPLGVYSRAPDALTDILVD